MGSRRPPDQALGSPRPRAQPSSTFPHQELEPLHYTTPEERERYLQQAGYNLSSSMPRYILIGLAHAIPHQRHVHRTVGRRDARRRTTPAAKASSASSAWRTTSPLPPHDPPTRAAPRAHPVHVMCHPGMWVPSNTHFDTTAPTSNSPARARVDLPIPRPPTRRPRSRFQARNNREGWPAARIALSASPTGAPRHPAGDLPTDRHPTTTSGGGQPVFHGTYQARQSASAAPRHPPLPGPAASPKNAWFIRERGARATPIWSPNHSRPENVISARRSVALLRTVKDAFANIGRLPLHKDDPPCQSRETQPASSPHRSFPTYGACRPGPAHLGPPIARIGSRRSARPPITSLPNRVSTGLLGRHMPFRASPSRAARRARHLH